MKEQLEATHMGETPSPQNSPMFVIKKKSEKWRMLTDLRGINKIIQAMGSSQFGIPLHKHDREEFALLEPFYNNA